jgi:ubiquitin-conjugating enzyme E2 Q
VPHIIANKTNVRKIRRLEVELTKFVLAPSFIVEQVGEHKKQWLIHFTKFEHIYDTPLIHQLIAHNITSVDIEFIFGTNFPFSPPFVRLLYPRIISNAATASASSAASLNELDIEDCDCIDIGGGICTGLFGRTSSGWSPAINLINFTEYIQSLIFCSPYLQLHPTSWNIPYTDSEALRAFNNIISTFTLLDAVDLIAV